MKLSQFKFELPIDLIAQYPATHRDESRLMVVHKDTGKIEHKVFKDVLDYFDEDDAFVVNNSKVFPARLYGHKEKTGAKIEVFLLRELNVQSRLWDVIVDPARKIRVGNKLFFGDNEELTAEVIDNTTSRGRTIRFLYEGSDEEFKEILYGLGQTPLPKYIKREPDAQDAERFQTIYAKHVGSVKPPAAGMHFSRELVKRLEIKGVNFAEITLHIGLGTFRPIEVEDLRKHKMDAEYYSIEEYASQIVNEAVDLNRKICAVGTSAMVAIESSITATNHLKPSSGWTNLFPHPPYDFALTDALITNFHLPKSSLLISAAGFGGYDLIMHAYNEAIKEKYRFFTYGDAMLII